MARFLALDWDHQQLHLVAATVSGGGVRIQQAQVWQEEHVPNLSEAEALGRVLRERMKEAGIPPAPVLACIGRDRVILKEIRYPAVPEAEEPAVVRFQAVKELTEPPDEVVIDYTNMGDVAATGERRALALIARRDLVEAYQRVVQAAGLKLAGLTPRPFGMAACLRRLASTSVRNPAADAAGSPLVRLPRDAAVAILALGERWAEFCVARGDALVFARSLPVGPNVAGEVRRNLAVYAGQAPPQPIRAVYVAGGREHAVLRERLQDLIEVPVHSFDPFAGVERPNLPLGGRGAFTGAVGLLHARADRQELPINFVRPKQPKAQSDPNKRRLVLAVFVAGILLLAGIGFCYAQLAILDRNLADEAYANSNLDRRLLELDEDAKRLKALGDWVDGGVNCLDELYDLTDRFPEPNTVRLTQLSFDRLTRTAKEKHAGTMTLKGITTASEPVDRLLSRIDGDGHYRVGPKEAGPNRGGIDRNFGQQFTTKVDVEKVPPSRYSRRLPDPPPDGVGASRQGQLPGGPR